MKYFLTILLCSSSLSASNYSICSETDSRVQLTTSPIARLSKQDGNRGCTATLVGKSCAITAGHCVKNLYRGEFNVPNSINGEPVQSQKEDTFFVNPESIEFQDEGRGNDWAVFNFKKNEESGLYPGDVYGFFRIENYEPKNSDFLRISGYGTHYDNDQMTYTLLSATGHGDYIGYSDEGRTLLNHKVDTTSGSSGSSVINVKTNKIIGIHGQGGCSSSRLIWNSATLINQHRKLQAAIKKCISK
jgi:V8-like Glu-specific endopeptidase